MDKIKRIVSLHLDSSGLKQPAKFTVPDGKFLEDSRFAVSIIERDLLRMQSKPNESDINDIICSLISEGLEIAHASGVMVDIDKVFSRWHELEYYP
jgi:hypothetical protein